MDFYVNRKKTLIMTGILLIIVLSGFIYYYSVGVKLPQDSTLTGPLAGSNGVLSDADTYKLGKNSFSSNIDASLALLKGLAQNEKADPYYRAKAIEFITEKSLVSSGDDTNKIFVGDPWAGFLPKSETGKRVPGDFDLARRRAFEWGYAMYPTMVAHQRITWWYVRQLRDDTSLPQESREEYISIVKENLSKGEAILEDEVKREGIVLLELQGIYTLEGINTGMGLFLETRDPIYRDKAIAWYEKAIAIDPLAGMSATFHLANLLRLSDGEKERQRIQGLLDTIIANYARNKNSPVYGYFSRERRESHKNHAHRQHVIDTGKFYKPFGDLLVTIGWPRKTFQ